MARAIPFGGASRGGYVEWPPANELLKGVSRSDISATLPLKGKVALVTGGGRGIGRAIAQAYAAAGAAVGCAARSLAEVDRTAQTIREAGGKALPVEVDVSDAESAQRMVDAVVDRFGRLDLLILTAGVIGDGRSVEESDPAAWKATIEVNLFGAYLSARAAIPALRRSGGGKIITIGSGAGHRGTSGLSAYACSKAALWMLTRVLARELATANIDVNELIPGHVQTDMLKSKATDSRRNEEFTDEEWFKAPEALLPLAMFLATQPLRGPSGQSFGLLRREV